MFLISKCTWDWNLGLCTTSGLAFGETQRNAKFRFSLRRNTFFFRKSPLRCGPKLCTDLDLSLLCILILGTYSKFARTNNFLALGLCFPQSCSSAGRMFTASRSHLQYYRRIVSFPQQKIRWNGLQTGFHCKSGSFQGDTKCLLSQPPFFQGYTKCLLSQPPFEEYPTPP